MAERTGFDATTFKDVDRQSYNLFARTWDRYSAVLSGPFAPRLVELARVSAGERVIEVCCGTGVISRAAAAVVGPSGHVLGTDLTPGMVEVAQEEAAAQGLRQAEFRVMDCEALELSDGTFDAGVAMYPHFSDHRRALRELHRVLRPGGRVAIGVGGGVARASSRPAPLALELMNEIIARYQPEDPGGHPPGWAGPDPAAGLAAALAEAGFVDLETSTHTHTAQLANAQEAWDVWSMTSSPVRHRLSLLDPDQRESVQRDFLAAFTPRASPENLDRRGGAIYAAGRKRG